MTSRKPPSQRNPEYATTRMARALQSMSPGSMGGRVANASPTSIRPASGVTTISAFSGAGTGIGFRGGVGTGSAIGGDLSVTATADGANSLALGDGTSASGNAATAVGPSAAATANETVAFGGNSVASGLESSALGTQAQAPGAHATAVGAQAMADGDDSTAIGEGAHCSQYEGVAVGSYAWADGQDAVVVGTGALASEDNSIALGAYSTGYFGGVAVGNNAQGLGTVGNSSVAVGRDAKAYAPSEVVLGENAHTRVSTDGENVVIGKDARVGDFVGSVSKTRSVVIGKGAETDQDDFGVIKVDTLEVVPSSASGVETAVILTDATGVRWKLTINATGVPTTVLA